MKQKDTPSKDTLPIRVDIFDELLEDGGIERGSVILLSGGAGTGKTTFCMQLLYYGAIAGEKGIYLSFEEEPENIKKHMKKNFGWDFEKLEKEGKVAIIKLDPIRVSRQVEQRIDEKKGLLEIELEDISFPFKPDKVCVDSLSALAIAFQGQETYRVYIKELFELLTHLNSTSFVISETDQMPKVYSRTGVEEFLADGVIVLYNILNGDKRENGLEILKLRSGKHEKAMIQYEINDKGIKFIKR